MVKLIKKVVNTNNMKIVWGLVVVFCLSSIAFAANDCEVICKEANLLAYYDANADVDDFTMDFSNCKCTCP